VTLLEHLGVPSSVFIALQSEYVDELSAALKANQSAERLLMSLGAALPSDDNDDNDDNAREQVEGGAMRAVLEMLRAGVSMDEPFLAGVLRALQAALLRDVVQRGELRSFTLRTTSPDRYCPSASGSSHHCCSPQWQPVC
jgi:hypothetical protein